MNGINKGPDTIGIMLNHSSSCTLIVVFKFQWVPYAGEENDQCDECTQADRGGPCQQREREWEGGTTFPL